jgi:hypothetical protein
VRIGPTAWPFTGFIQTDRQLDKYILAVGLTLKTSRTMVFFGKQGLGCIYILDHATRQKLLKTKFVGQACFSGGSSCFWHVIRIWKDPAPCASGAMVNQFLATFIEQK